MLGRDHWPSDESALVSGGGLRMGQVVGATNSKAEYPVEWALTPQDLLATVYRHLGIDPRSTITDFADRPVAILAHGEPIRELVCETPTGEVTGGRWASNAARQKARSQLAEPAGGVFIFLILLDFVETGD